MDLILNVETSSTNCSVSLSLNGQQVGLKEDRSSQFSHAESLHVFIEELIEESDFDTSNISAVAVSKGPGSYTGLRIGVSAAKGLCFAWNVPLIAVSTLEALAFQVNIDKGIIIPMLDARRLEVYSAVFDSKFQMIREIKAEILNSDSYREYLDHGNVYFIGTGVEKTKALIEHSNAYFIENALPSADQMTELAYKKYKKNDIEDVAYFEPFYLKDFVATKSKKI